MFRNPYTFENGKIAKNRIVVPAMASQTATENGVATKQTVEHYAKLATSGAGIVFSEYAFVNSGGRAERNQLGLETDEHEQAIIPIARAIHDAGALAGFQLAHAGGKSSTNLTCIPLQSPSGIQLHTKDTSFETPVEMSIGDIENWKISFLNSAIRAHRAGFDIVELHAAHGYGLNQWISPITNQRTDSYGGSLEGRSRLLLEIVDSIRAKVPDLLISVRIPGRDFVDSGLELDETIKIAQQLVAHGADLINVSSGIGGWRNPTSRVEQGYLVPEASRIQKHIDAPVIAVGGIKTTQYIGESIAKGMFQFAAVGRAILKGEFSL